MPEQTEGAVVASSNTVGSLVAPEVTLSAALAERKQALVIEHCMNASKTFQELNYNVTYYAHNALHTGATNCEAQRIKTGNTASYGVNCP